MKLYINQEYPNSLYTNNNCGCSSPIPGSLLQIKNSCFQVTKENKAVSSICLGDFFVVVNEHNFSVNSIAPFATETITACADQNIQGMVVAFEYDKQVNSETERFTAWRFADEPAKAVLGNLAGQLSFAFTDLVNYKTVRLMNTLTYQFQPRPASDINIYKYHTTTASTAPVTLNSYIKRNETTGFLEEKVLFEGTTQFDASNFGPLNARIKMTLLPTSTVIYSSGAWHGLLNFQLDFEFVGSRLRSEKVSTTYSATFDGPTTNFLVDFDAPLSLQEVYDYDPVSKLLVFTSAPNNDIRSIEIYNAKNTYLKYKIITTW